MDTPRLYVMSTQDGTKYSRRRLMVREWMIPDMKCEMKLTVAPKAMGDKVIAPLIWSELYSSESDSPQAQNPNDLIIVKVTLY